MDVPTEKAWCLITTWLILAKFLISTAKQPPPHTHTRQKAKKLLNNLCEPVSLYSSKFNIVNRLQYGFFSLSTREDVIISFPWLVSFEASQSSINEWWRLKCKQRSKQAKVFLSLSLTKAARECARKSGWFFSQLKIVFVHLQKSAVVS